MATGAVFMSHPTAVLQQYLSQKGDLGYDRFYWGRLAMALEILTQMKILNSLPFTDLTVQLESAFQALLIDSGMMDDAERWYERLDAWRQPRFVSAGRPTDRAFGASSIAASPEGELARTRRLRRLQQEHHGPDDLSTSESEESPDVEERSTST